MCSKYTEFALWASESQRIDIEILPKLEERELFRTFCEDFNTATLPHRKFYDIQEYERRKEERKALKQGSSDVRLRLLFQKILCLKQGPNGRTAGCLQSVKASLQALLYSQ